MKRNFQTFDEGWEDYNFGQNSLMLACDLAMYQRFFAVIVFTVDRERRPRLWGAHGQLKLIMAFRHLIQCATEN
jgi:hypothetical protein